LKDGKNTLETLPKGFKMAKPGPKSKIDLILLEKLAAIHCTNTEIAATLDCDSSLMSRPQYAEIIRKGRERGKLSLRRKMYEMATHGDRTMLIWLSKQYLGMADKQQNDDTLKVEGLKELKSLSTEQLVKEAKVELKKLNHE
jgi:hypothetical protein